MKKRELGDFQTPISLAESLVSLLKDKKISPEIIIEPTCGKGSILLSAYNAFKSKKNLGIEIQKEYAEELNKITNKNITILNKDFFVSFLDIKNFIADNEQILFIV